MPQSSCAVKRSAGVPPARGRATARGFSAPEGETPARQPPRRGRYLKHGGFYGTQNSWNHGGGLGKSNRLRSSPPRTPAESERSAEAIVDGRPALLRHEQRALPH